jgi:hypothetical protein
MCSDIRTRNIIGNKGICSEITRNIIGNKGICSEITRNIIGNKAMCLDIRKTNITDNKAYAQNDRHWLLPISSSQPQSSHHWQDTHAQIDLGS